MEGTNNYEAHHRRTDGFDGHDRRESDSFLRQEFNILHKDLSEIKDRKQDKIKPVVFFSVFAYLLSTAVGGAWWASAMTAQLSNISKVIEQQAGDRYTSLDARHDFANRDQRLDFMQQQLQELIDDSKKR